MDTLELWEPRMKPAPEGFVSALIGGGDSRLALDPFTGRNRYFVPPRPDADCVAFSSCTASPITVRGWEAALSCYDAIAGSRSESMALARRLNAEFAVTHALGEWLAPRIQPDVVLLPSGTDGLLYASLLLAVEAGGKQLTPVLPCPAETGAGVPAAVTGRRFDVVAGRTIGAVTVPLRSANGARLPAHRVSEGFAEAAAAVVKGGGTALIVLTHCTKTGIVGPCNIPPGAEVVVDACQLRLARTDIEHYLWQGWPVVVSGSKALGGPPFSGAVLLPRGRFSLGARIEARKRWRSLAPADGDRTSGELGPLLRWVAALAPLTAGVTRDLGDATADLRLSHLKAVLRAVPGIVVLDEHPVDPSPSPYSSGIALLGLRDVGCPQRLLSVAEVKAVYAGLAARGVLLGQPVDLGAFGALRCALSLLPTEPAEHMAGLEKVAAELSIVASEPTFLLRDTSLARSAR